METSFLRSRNFVYGLMLFCWLSGCSRDEQALGDTEVVLHTAKRVLELATTGSDRQAGLQAAKDFLTQNAETLRTSSERLKALKGYQISDGTLETIKRTMKDSGETISRLRVALEKEILADAAIDVAVEGLIQQFTNAVNGADAAQSKTP